MNDFLFSYGTLQNKSIQKSLFGRHLVGVEDVLLGYKMELINLSDGEGNTTASQRTYPIVVPSRNKKESIKGVVYELSQEEIKMADDYEGEAYQRVKVTLKSGKKCWLYIKA